jgi:hypothetical protein
MSIPRVSDTIRYNPSPTGLLLHNDLKSEVRFIMGPVGAGKTSIALMEIFFTGLRQQPDANNVRSTRWVAIRSTFPELKSTVIKTWEEWMGDMATTVYDTPIRSNVYRQLADGTTLDIEVWFLALEREEDVKKLRSLEVTGGFISEASETPKPIFDMLQSRTGRYPKTKKELNYGPTWFGVVMESNPPPMEHWLYTMFEVEKPKEYAIFRQPAPFVYDANLDTDIEADKYFTNPLAENIDNLPGGYTYYRRLLKNKTKHFIDVYIMGEYGSSHAGKPVYPQFQHSKHVSSRHIDPMPGRLVVVGFDFGLNSAAVFTQMTPTGSILVLDEVLPQNCTLEEFMDSHVSPLRATRYSGCPMLIIGDPAGMQRSSLAQLTAFQTLEKRGYSSRPAHTNDVVMRVQSAAYFMDRAGGIIVDPRCVGLIDAWRGGYKFSKRRNTSGGKNEFKDEPDKGSHSHIADAANYVCLYYKMGLVSPRASANTAPKPSRAKQLLA